MKNEYNKSPEGSRRTFWRPVSSWQIAPRPEGGGVKSIVYLVFMSRMLNANYSEAHLACFATSKAARFHFKLFFALM